MAAPLNRKSFLLSPPEYLQYQQAYTFAVVLFLSRSSAISGPWNRLTQDEPQKEGNAEIDVDALNPYGQAVARMGLAKCAAAMNDLSAKLLQGKRVGVYRFPTVHESFVSLSMEVEGNQGAIIYMTFDLSQDANGTCQIVYETVSDWANTCDDVAKTIFNEFTPTRDLLKSVALLTNKENSYRKVFTMPVQNGCIAIEKQVVSTPR